MLCDGDCDGLPTSHGEDDLILGEDGRTLCLSAWPGGPETPVCVSWALAGLSVSSKAEVASRSMPKLGVPIQMAPPELFAAHVQRMSNWVGEDQQLGPLDSIAPVVADGVMVIRREHRAIAEEGRKQ